MLYDNWFMHNRMAGYMVKVMNIIKTTINDCVTEISKLFKIWKNDSFYSLILWQSEFDSSALRAYNMSNVHVLMI